MTEAEAIAKIHSVYPSGKKNGLENMRALMRRLGNPQERLRMVHVAGTNGKGSTCALMERALREAGYKTGLYSSPYIERYNERIRLDGKPIEGEALASLVEQVFPAVEACREAGIQITEFELGTALAFCAFHQAQVDVAIIEVGLGGRLDPTNIITPLVSVITGVGMDHMDYLGNTIEEIALEKAGIMKSGVPVVLGAQEKAALSVLHAAAKGKGCPLIDPDADNVRETQHGITFDTSVMGKAMKDISISLPGRHQAENACAALGALFALGDLGYCVSDAAIRSAFADVRWPGRLEYFGRILLDGAHNDPGVRALCAYIDKWLLDAHVVLLTGMMGDKETDKMAERLAPRVDRVVCTTPPVPRAMHAEALAQVFHAHGAKAFAKDNVKDALAYARSLAGPGGMVLCAGSLYLIGEVRTLLRQEKEYADVI